jgi:hypothetical protein
VVNPPQSQPQAKPQEVTAMLSVAQLDSWLGKSMTDICLNGYDTPTDNHCAHFVSHAAALNFGYTCKHHTGKQNAGANLRVHEVFAQCPSARQIQECSSTLTGLIFVSGAANFASRGGRTVLANVPKKHIGFLLGGSVWHYSNSQHRVVKQPMSQFLFHYPGQTNALWLGTFPPGARALWYGQC